MRNFGNRTGAIAAVAALLGAGAAANAEISTTIFSVSAQNSIGTDSWSFTLPTGGGQFTNGAFDWIFSQPIMLSNGLEIQAAQIHLQDDPIVSLSFSLNNTAGVDTNISVTSPLLSFAAISGATGNASASVSLTDVRGDGASLTPVGASGYTAFYNGGAAGTGTQFANLFSTAKTIAPTGDPFGTTMSWTEDSPSPGGYSPMGSVSDASAGWAFVLSPEDLASGSSTFTIVPTPGSLSLLAVGSLVFTRRRRR